MMTEHIKKITIKFLQGSINREEQQELRKWIHENDENRQLFEEIESVWYAIEIREFEKKHETNDIWQKFNHKLHKLENKRKKKIYFRFVQVAATIILAIGLGFVFQHILPDSNEPEKSKQLTMHVPPGSKTDINLPDGTKVWLNSGSTFSFSENFGKNKRTVQLDGEAYFEVAKHKSIPFLVQTSHINIEVLGTSFNVKSYQSDNTIETTLVEGMIKLKSKNTKTKSKGITLKPNQKATYRKEDKKLELKNLAVKEEQEKRTAVKKLPEKKMSVSSTVKMYTAWKDNKLIFDNEDFSSIIIKLERWYGVDIHLQNKNLLSVKLTGSFENETIDQALKALQIAHPFKYKMDKKNITIY